MPLPIRFWSKVDKSQFSPGGCWEWQAGTTRAGYGRFRLGKKTRRAHRLSFLDSGGVLTIEKPFVLHKCNNRPCVNPSHLKAGNGSDNDKDAQRAGTFKFLSAQRNKALTHCTICNNLLDGDNLLACDLKRGRRKCRVCHSRRQKIYRENRKNKRKSSNVGV